MHDHDSDSQATPHRKAGTGTDGTSARPTEADTLAESRIATEPESGIRSDSNHEPSTDADTPSSSARPTEPESDGDDLTIGVVEDALPESIGVHGLELIEALRFTRTSRQTPLPAFTTILPKGDEAEPRDLPASPAARGAARVAEVGDGATTGTGPDPAATYIGRYRVIRVLGKGGLGRVYLAYDGQLEREVAIKVPIHLHESRYLNLESYLKEARIIARLSHANIVPVYDVGRTEDDRCYVVSKYMDGGDLAALIHRRRPASVEAAQLIAVLCDALHYTHTQDLFHRDIKPANILLDVAGIPSLADFGLALKDEELGQGARLVGTAAYMSPEQARGEGHRVDGRSDIFSLGIVLYELLTGRRPFRGSSRDQVMEQIIHSEPRPLRQIDDTIPRELERICLKALSKRASERYSTARDLGEDMRHFLKSTLSTMSMEGPSSATISVTTATATETSPTVISVSSDSLLRAVRIVPKGLGSFGEDDAEFFLELLPGPRDRDGLPDGLRFWKTRIEAIDPDKTFRVGLIYGPSGCGKSSLVKAGLLPRLGQHVVTVYVEATVGETEARLRRGIRKRYSALPADAGLVASLAILRRDQDFTQNRKVLVVLDQFEQWLFAHRGEPASELVAALRQCDGEHLQVLCLVRDDFWMAAIRFMRDLEIDLVPDRNVAAVDLFEPKHVRKVLAAYGRAYEALPQRPGDLTREQRAFLDQAVDGLAQDGRVVPVRLALFAEMIKRKPWTPATLREVGGMDGVGVTFLEETFSSARSNPNYRYHQKAAQAVLKALLPESNADIKGRMRSIEELRNLSGYVDRPTEFLDLIRMLDNELRLITPVDPDRSIDEDKPALLTGTQGYQLTHDYLVHSLREWLTRKQRETRRGRAELRLAEITSSWRDRPGARRLPSPWEWLDILAYTRSASWSDAERKMIHAASRRYTMRALAAAILVAVLSIASLEYRRRVWAEGLISKLRVADTSQVPTILEEIDKAPDRFRAELDRIAGDPGSSPKERLHSRLAVLPGNGAYDNDLVDQLLGAEPDELIVIVQRLRSRRAAFVDRLWAVASDAGGDSKMKLRAACALASLDPIAGTWNALAPKVSDTLVLDENSVRLQRWLDALQPVRNALLEPLAAIFRDRKRTRNERFNATVILQRYAVDRPRSLVQLIKDADLRQLAMLLPVLEPHRTVAIPWLSEGLDEHPPIAAPEEAKDELASQQANCAVTLLLLNEPRPVWPLFTHSPEPYVRGHLLDRIEPMGVDPRLLAARLLDERDITARRALILALSEYRAERLPAHERASLVSQLLDAFQNDPDPGIHSAAERLLRNWGHGDQVVALIESLSAGRRDPRRRWYVNKERHTMAIIDPRGSDQALSSGKRIDHVFAISTKEVSVKQFLAFGPRPSYAPEHSPTPDCPINVVTWYDAAKYCRRLSERENLQEKEMCYPPVEDIKEGMKLPKDYLNRTGYRLPTEAEAEYACRANAVTSRPFGCCDKLLPRYAYFRDNSRDRTWPVGSLWPNDLGLFDALGNVLEWCQESHMPIANPDDCEESDSLSNLIQRPLRGGSYDKVIQKIRSDRAEHALPVVQFNEIGFRVARTERPQP